MKWTKSLPDKTGWFWHRHTVGDNHSDTPLHAIIMRHPIKWRGKWGYKYDVRPSIYWRGKWTDVKELPTGWNYWWSDKPIRLPNSQ